MALIDQQRAVLALCFDPRPSDAQFAALGDARIFGIYREAVRNRLFAELKVAFKRTFAAAGETAMQAAFDAFLAQEPPRTRFFHAVAGSFAAHALAHGGIAPALRGGATFFARGVASDVQAAQPAHVADLCAYEAAQWAVADLPDRPPAPFGEFGFDKQPVLSPALRLLALKFPVHEPMPSSGYVAGEHFVCVHRSPDQKQGQPWRINAVMFALMQRFVTGAESVSAAVQAVAAERAIAVDAPFLDGLCTVLADFIERGVILGGR